MVSHSVDRAGPTRDEVIARAIEDFKNEGYVVFESCLPTAYVDELRREYMSALNAKVARLGLTPVVADERLYGNENVRIDFRAEGGNHDLNRWNMHLPSRRPFLDNRLVANPFVMGVIDGILGKDAVLAQLVSDTPFPNSGFQNIHQDDSLLRITANVALVDFTEENAPTEIWPRTHRPDPEKPTGTFVAEPYELSVEETKRRAKLPSKRMLLKAGSILLRDHRLLHRGTANLSNAPRPMLTLNFCAAPGDIPSRFVTNRVAQLALLMRERARALTSDLRQPLLDAGKNIDRTVEYSSGSDRDARRTIPADIWAELDPAAQRLLRFASVEGRKDGEGSSMGASLRLLRSAAIQSLTVGRYAMRG